MAEVGGRVSIALCKSFIILLNVLNVDASICYLPSNLDRPSITIAQFGNGLYALKDEGHSSVAAYYMSA